MFSNIATILIRANGKCCQLIILSSIELVDPNQVLIGATASAVNWGQVASISLTNVGSGYSEAPKVSIAYPNTGVIEDRATAIASVNNGEVEINCK